MCNFAQFCAIFQFFSSFFFVRVICVLGVAWLGWIQINSDDWNEVANLARISDPGVVRIHDAGVVDGTPYFAMDVIAEADINRPDGDSNQIPQVHRAVVNWFTEMRAALGEGSN